MDYDFNIYSFSNEQPDLSSYDVSACYLFHKREKFHISLPGEFSREFVLLFLIQSLFSFIFIIFTQPLRSGRI